MHTTHINGGERKEWRVESVVWEALVKFVNVAGPPDPLAWRVPQVECFVAAASN